MIKFYNILQEIGIHNPNKSAEDIINLLTDELSSESYTKILDILEKYNWSTTPDSLTLNLWLKYSLDQNERNKIYNNIKNVTDSDTENSS